jgi:flagellar biogenesis protein FliO
MGELLLRMVFSLAVVVGLLILISRVAARRLHGRAGSPIEVLHRQALSKSASVSVVSVAGRVLVLGSTDQQVNVLTELDPDAFSAEEDSAAEAAAEHDEQSDDLAEDLTGDELTALLAGETGSIDPAAYDSLPSLEALLAEPDQVTLEELFGHRPPTHAAPATSPAAAAAAYAAPVVPAPAPAQPTASDEEDPFLPEDPSYAAFASALRAQLATGAHADPVSPAVSSGAARTTEAAPAAPVAPAQPTVAAAPAGPSAADLAALRAALLSAQLQAGSSTAARTTAPTSRPVPEAGLAPEGALSGSVLSPTTWRQAYRAVTRRAS